MKRVVLISIVALIAVSCGSKDKQDQLRQLEAQRDKLNLQIEQLRNELANSGVAEANAIYPHVVVRKIEPETFRHFVKIQGTIESDHNILIPAQYSGVVRKIYVQEGQAVKKDQLLAELDGSILENSLAELNVNLDLARTVYERQKRLWDKNIGSEVQYLQAKTNLEALQKRKAAVEEQYELTKIKSPIDGTVDEILLKEGEGAAAGFGTIRVVSLSALKITARLSEQYAGKVRPGDPVDITLPTVGKTFRSTLRSVSQVIDPKNRTFPLEVRVPDGLSGVHPNMMAVLTINDYSRNGAVTVPMNIVQRMGSDNFLFVARPTGNPGPDHWQVEKRLVETGLISQDRIEVNSGLQSGEFVVIQGFQELADGQKVLASDKQN